MDEWKNDAKNAITKYLGHTKDILKVIQITNALKPLCIDSFFYNIHRDKKRELTVSNNIPWLNYCIENLTYQDTYHIKHINFKNDFSIFFSDMIPNGRLRHDLTTFNMPSVLFLIYNIDNGKYTESFVFTSQEISDIAYRKFYDNLEYLKEFCLYFKDIGHDLITNNRINHVSCNTLSNAINTDNINLFNIKRYFLSYPFENVYLTQKELVILKEVIYGHSLKDIAKKYDISFRTAEKHIENVKIKIGTNDKYVLYKILINSDLIHRVK